ncbi:hypothetical protein WS70_17745 [Burkholderia mayonis]|uniref:Uncharacterized protein n=1 Tax=Burkholderia mayonis TaxID=1385591 RepID=A0A1B4FJC2_9BURK|nr:hypothetical protein WS70_17745 [Burkholderia mayonis]KVE42496.1 hypothetical protein WS70_11810 [Burkholderia mayonis]
MTPRGVPFAVCGTSRAVALRQRNCKHLVPFLVSCIEYPQEHASRQRDEVAAKASARDRRDAPPRPAERDRVRPDSIRPASRHVAADAPAPGAIGNSSRPARSLAANVASPSSRPLPPGAEMKSDRLLRATTIDFDFDIDRRRPAIRKPDRPEGFRRVDPA